MTIECAPLGDSMAEAYRHFSTEFKLGVIESYLAGHGVAKAIANAAGIMVCTPKLILGDSPYAMLLTLAVLAKPARNGPHHNR